ncbi:sulfatase-like hydrolase/transferase [Lentisphaera marina]|uniref:sulfatase family protein n=1 Tax=Lentisphaera marina TaxID=1111041 RepID=UPI002366FA28|nr:sulfatase-like hydrolase/transferase [Lentisphaera marina]MDD7986431.1 sulfatase-like hydrolase/transferase [Lentisphaera marina]
MKGFIYKTAILSMAMSCLCSFSSLAKEKTAQSPNIIFFIADDMYPEMFNCLPEGKGKNLTPNIDRLAREGVFMSNQRVASPVCTPSRYNCLTGNYASRAINRGFLESTKINEGQAVVQFNTHIVPGKDKTMGTYFQQLGYKTGFVGKNHVVDSPSQINPGDKPDLQADPKDPKVKAGLEHRHQLLQEDIKNCGFDFADNLYHNNPTWLGIKALAVQNMDWVAEGALRFLEIYKDEPVFLYVAATLTHTPLNPENSYDGDSRVTAKGILDHKLDVLPSRASIKERIKEAGLQGDDVTNLLWMDDSLGAILNKLEETEKIDNTIIVFFNDHGLHNKGTLYEGGLQSECIIWRSAGFECGSTSDAVVSNIDFLATLLDYAGHENPNELSDGRSFKAALECEAYENRKSMYYELGYARAVVKGKYKYIKLNYPEYAKNATAQERKKMLDRYNNLRRSFGGEAINLDPTLPYGHLELFPGGGGAENKTFGKKPGFFDLEQLYDLEADAGEQVNLVKNPEYAQKIQEMRRELKAHLDKVPGTFGELKK